MKELNELLTKLGFVFSIASNHQPRYDYDDLNHSLRIVFQGEDVSSFEELICDNIVFIDFVSGEMTHLSDKNDIIKSLKKEKVFINFFRKKKIDELLDGRA